MQINYTGIYGIYRIYSILVQYVLLQIRSTIRLYSIYIAYTVVYTIAVFVIGLHSLQNAGYGIITCRIPSTYITMDNFYIPSNLEVDITIMVLFTKKLVLPTGRI